MVKLLFFYQRKKLDFFGLLPNSEHTEEANLKQCSISYHISLSKLLTAKGQRLFIPDSLLTPLYTTVYPKGNGHGTAKPLHSSLADLQTPLQTETISLGSCCGYRSI